MPIRFDDNLLREVCDLQAKREAVFSYPHSIRWLALAKNVGEAFDCYFRQDKHYITELADSMVNVLMILKEENVDVEQIINYSLERTKSAIESQLEKEIAE